MRKLTIIYDGTLYTYKWIKTILWAKKQFENEGLSIEYISWKSMVPIGSFAKGQVDTVLTSINRRMFDIVVIAFHYSISDFRNSLGIDKIEFLKLLKDKCNRLIWLDTADSTGNCQFDVMPYVDVYLKKQIFSNLDLYTKKLYGTKLYTDFYHQKLGIDDKEAEVDDTLLNPNYKEKIGISWNIGLSDFWTKSRYCLIRPYKIPHPTTQRVRSYRTVKLFFNGSMSYSLLNGYQRRRTIELIEGLKDSFNPSPTLKMSHNQYVDYMKHSKSVISPFGWGEICYRDFEAFVYGATLIKPDMGQISTFPNFFVAGETYVPIKWDFSDFNDVVAEIGSERFKCIAERAQEMYKEYVSGKQAKQLFVNHILSSIGL